MNASRQRSDGDSAPNGLSLRGLDGSNPLGFLAAIGALRAASRREPREPVKLAWRSTAGVWRPSLFGAGSTIDDLLVSIAAGLRLADSTPWSLDKKLPFEAKRFREAARQMVAEATARQRDAADTIAGLGVESLKDDAGVFSDTALRMVRAGDSAGNGLLAYGKRIIKETSDGDLRHAINEQWAYEDDGCALRWDAAENRSYALQWYSPSGEPAVSVRGANRLALDALPMLPTVPIGTKARTTSFGSPDGDIQSFTWPLWECPISLNIVQSLLTLRILQQQNPEGTELRARGICAVYRCNRIMTSKYYRNFTPAMRVA